MTEQKFTNDRTRRYSDADSVSLRFVVYEDNSSNEGDSDGLEIDENVDLNNSQKLKKSKYSKMDPKDKLVLENIEEEIERQLDEKAAKSNMSVVNVKNILKHVITNEHVLAMVRQSIGDSTDPNEYCTFEPKLTRAKAKELLKTRPEVAISWLTPPKNDSEVNVLINQELPDEESDEEYVPHEEESEDDSLTFDSGPTTPATPSSSDCATQTAWSEDGVFKVPQIITTPRRDTKMAPENIALRTRSKFSLSDTPLESIEMAFVPPDITTDMYESECDDEDWQNFLQEFTQPLPRDAAVTAEDDYDADPEYNVLADEEIDAVDKEELRADKGVKVTKRELNDLVSELFDYVDLFTPPHPADPEPETTNNNTSLDTTTQEKEQQPQSVLHENTISVISFSSPEKLHQTKQSSSNTVVDPLELHPQPSITSNCATECTDDVVITSDQILLLKQQLRQHVQLCTQNFLQTYEHPYFSELAKDFQAIIINMLSKISENINSILNASNLLPAINLMTVWEYKFKGNLKEAIETKEFVKMQLEKFNSYKKFRNFYPGEFSPMFKETVSTSDVFLYPNLLPITPLMGFTKTPNFIKSEDELIAIGLEQFFPHIESIKEKKTKTNVKDLAFMISRYVMPSKDPFCIYNHIKMQKSKNRKPKDNPIYYYFQHKKAPTTTHFVVPTELYPNVPPILQAREMLPEVWQKYLYETFEKTKKKNIFKPKSTKTLQPVHKRYLKKLKPILPVPEIPTAIINNSNNNAMQISINITIGNQQNIDINKELSIDIPELENQKSKQNSSISVKPTQLIRRSVRHCNRGDLDSNRVKYSHIANTHPKIRINQSIFKNKNLEMLPSMPFLLTPLKNPSEKEVPKPNSKLNDTINDFNITNSAGNTEIIDSNIPVINENNTEIASKIYEESITKETEKDNEDEIKSLMIASSTIKSKPKKTVTAAEKKKFKLQREFDATAMLLVDEDPKIVDEKATNYAQAYLSKVKERLSSNDEYTEFLSVLSEHDTSTESVPDLYSKVDRVLSPNHSDLSEEFLTFLTPAQAEQIGKLTEHTSFTRMSTFLQKLEIYYAKQPAQIRKIYNCLIQLTSTDNVTIDNVKAQILPLLKGNNLLLDYFLQIFGKEKPPESLMSTWENVDCDKICEPNEEVFEEFIIPDIEDPYGGNNCICSCHKSTDDAFKTRIRHCLSCGTKFIQGRLYIQTSKGPRPASVTFPGSSIEEQNKRFGVNATLRQKRRSETCSPTKNIMSPTKHSLESEDDEHPQAKIKNSPKPSRTLKSPKNSPTSRKARMKIGFTKHDSLIKSKVNDEIKTDNTPKSGYLTPLVVSVSSSSEICIQKRASPRFQSQTSDPNDPNIVNSVVVLSPTRESKRKMVKVSPDQNMEINDKTILFTKNEIEIMDVNESPDKKSSKNGDVKEWEDCNTSTESNEIKLSPNHSIESIDMCEESSQDMSVCQDDVQSDNDSLVEIESVHSDCSSPAHSDEDKLNDNAKNEELETSKCKETDSKNTSWTREEDRIILEMFQKEFNNENIFEKINSLLPTRTIAEIQERFRTLLQLVQQITSSS